MTIRLANTISGTTSSNLLKRATLALALLAGASSASAQDQFRFGNSSVGRVNEARSGASSRDSAASRSSSRGASRIDSFANSRTLSRPDTVTRPTFVDRAPSFNRSSSDRTMNSARNSGRSGSDRNSWSGGRSAIDPDGDGIGMRNPGSSRDRDGKNDWKKGNDRDKDRHGYDGRKHWDDDDNFRLRVSLGSSWSSCSYGCGSSCSHASYGYGHGYGYSGNVCGVNAYHCGGCSSCLGWSGSSVVYSSTSLSSGWVDPWDVPYVEPVVIVPQTVVQPVYVVQEPLVIYATTDVSNAILAADSGAHARGITLMRAYAAQHGRLPDNAELGPAARAALENVWRFYERAALAPGANADTFFMLGACRALRGDRALATDALDAAIARGDTDASVSALRAWCAQ